MRCQTFVRYPTAWKQCSEQSREGKTTCDKHGGGKWSKP